MMDHHSSTRDSRYQSPSHTRLSGRVQTLGDDAADNGVEISSPHPVHTKGRSKEMGRDPWRIPERGTCKRAVSDGDDMDKADVANPCIAQG